MALTDDDVREILRIIDESSLDELLIETEGFSLHVRKGGASPEGAAAVAAQQPRAATAGAPPGAAATSAPAAAPAPNAAAAASPAGAGSPDAGAATGSAGPEAGSAGEAAASSDGVVEIPSPMLGTFYRAESPGAKPFVEVGSRVEPETTVCIIEVMKMMNSVAAGVSGTVAEVVAENAQLVEFGQPLFRVTPDA